jgi:hypothetical protein
MTRVYVPTTLLGLARAQKLGVLDDDPADDDSAGGTSAGGAGASRIAAHAVTGRVREWYVEGNLEELEYSALIDAAESSLRLLAREPLSPRRRVVVAVDVPDALLAPGGEHRSSVWIIGPIELSRVVSVHVDEVESRETIAAAIAALGSAADGDEDARFQLDEAEACDLLWYDISEIDDLIG